MNDWGWVNGGISFGSERKLCGGEKREECASGVDVFEPLAGLERGGSTGDDNIFAERGAVLDSYTRVCADGVTDRRLEEEEFQRLGAFEAEEVYVGKGFEFGGDIEVGASVGEEDAGVDEFGLAFVFTAAEIGDQAAGRSEENPGACEANSFAIPEAEDAASEIREVEDRIEAAGAGVARVGIAGSVEGGNAVAHPVVIVREFGGSELGVDCDWATSDGVKSVFADGLIEGVREIEAADVAATEPAEITDSTGRTWSVRAR